MPTELTAYTKASSLNCQLEELRKQIAIEEEAARQEASLATSSTSQYWIQQVERAEEVIRNKEDYLTKEKGRIEREILKQQEYLATITEQVTRTITEKEKWLEYCRKNISAKNPTPSSKRYTTLLAKKKLLEQQIERTTPAPPSAPRVDAQKVKTEIKRITDSISWKMDIVAKPGDTPLEDIERYKRQIEEGQKKIEALKATLEGETSTAAPHPPPVPPPPPAPDVEVSQPVVSEAEIDKMSPEQLATYTQRLSNTLSRQIQMEAQAEAPKQILGTTRRLPKAVVAPR